MQHTHTCTPEHTHNHARTHTPRLSAVSTGETQQVFQTSKQLLASAGVLVHYDPALELIVAGDVSDYGLGAVLSQKMRNGEERPVAFASRSLSAAEKNHTHVHTHTHTHTHTNIMYMDVWCSAGKGLIH